MTEQQKDVDERYLGYCIEGNADKIQECLKSIEDVTRTIKNALEAYRESVQHVESNAEKDPGNRPVG